MYVCICNAITEADVRREAEGGVRKFSQLQDRTGCSTCCGCCENEAQQTLRKAVHVLQTRQLPLTIAA